MLAIFDVDALFESGRLINDVQLVDNEVSIGEGHPSISSR